MGIRVEKLTLRYEQRAVLENIDLEIAQGEFLAILGPNGSGKTSLAYCLNGIIPHAVSASLEGNISIDNLDPRKVTIGELAHKVGMVFQDPNLVIFNLTVEEEVAFGVKNLQLPNPTTRVNEALELVGLQAYAKRDPNTLSEGEKQKLCIAAVLAMGTDYLVLDEPISHLDYESAVKIYDFLKQLNEQGKTIIVIEHDTDFVWDYAKRAIILKNGKIQKDGAAREVLANADELRQLGIRPTFKRGANLLSVER